MTLKSGVLLGKKWVGEKTITGYLTQTLILIFGPLKVIYPC